MKNISWKLVLVFAVVVTAIIYILPSFKPALWPHKQINLGLDLQGGMHLVLEVDTDKAVESTIERISQEIREQLKKKRIRSYFISLLHRIPSGLGYHRGPRARHSGSQRGNPCDWGASCSSRDRSDEAESHPAHRVLDNATTSSRCSAGLERAGTLCGCERRKT